MRSSTDMSDECELGKTTKALRNFRRAQNIPQLVHQIRAAKGRLAPPNPSPQRDYLEEKKKEPDAEQYIKGSNARHKLICKDFIDAKDCKVVAPNLFRCYAECAMSNEAHCT